MSDTWMELRRLAAEAHEDCPAPWRFIPAHRGMAGNEPSIVEDACGDWVAGADTRDATAYIAAANPAQVLALLDALDRLTSDNKRMETQGWQTIETAPKDARRLLIFTSPNNRNPNGLVREAWWATPYEGGGSHGWWQALDCRVYEIDVPGKPTHWRPLPAPPGLTSKEGEDE